MNSPLYLCKRCVITTNRVFVALDNMSQEEVEHFLSTADELPNVKIGLELFCRYGRDLVIELAQKYKKNVFLDLKLHDIPNTVEKTIYSLEGLPIKFLTIHLSGGPAMITATLHAQKKALPNTTILGVSYLTSLGLNDLQNIWGIQYSPKTIKRIFKMGIDAGISALVLSGYELPMAKELGNDVIKVCPGIRFSDEIDHSKDDQARVFTPQDAFAAGADYLVMGRSLTNAKNLPARLQELKT